MQYKCTSLTKFEKFIYVRNLNHDILNLVYINLIEMLFINN